VLDATPLRPNQERAITAAKKAAQEGYPPQCIVGPPGCGKSRIMRELARWGVERGWRVNLYTHRVMVTSQTIETFTAAGVPFGCRAAGFERYQDDAAPVQICSLPTEYRRLATPGLAHQLDDADLVLVDEIHQQASTAGRYVFGKEAEDGYRGHFGRGASVLGFSATPVRLRGLVQGHIEAGNYREMRDIRAHVPVQGFGAPEPDFQDMRIKELLARNARGEFSSRGCEKVFSPEVIFGDVFSHWNVHNPDGAPTVLYAPSSKAALWFVHKWHAMGVAAAAITDQGIIHTERSPAGTLVKRERDPTPTARQEVLELVRNGIIKVLNNRFILRESIDLPELYCCVMATAMGSLSAFLQSVGRLQRYFPAYDGWKILIDHGGNWDRHLSPNMNRSWPLHATDIEMAKAIKALKESIKGNEAEPIQCPKCRAFRKTGKECYQCGHRHAMSVRPVRMHDGKLVQKRGRQTKYKPPKTKEAVCKAAWKSALFRAGRANCTLAQAVKFAKDKCEGVCEFDLSLTGMDLPKWGDPQWGKLVRHVYPWTVKPRAKKASA
jgi:superfamily II DNA or RNA helicase